MTVFQQVLWMLVNIRLLGRHPTLPLAHESLIHYAAALEVQYSRICEHLGTVRRREAADIALGIIGLLGLIQAAEPLPTRLLILLERHESGRSCRFPFRRSTRCVCSSEIHALLPLPPKEV
jgi:hypothetical protein